MLELLWLPATIAAYAAAVVVRQRTSSPLANPTLIAISTLVAVLAISGADYDHYEDGTGLISWFLGPAVVALAVPLHRHREALLRHGVALVAGTVVGVVAAIVVGSLAASILELSEDWKLALESRSATAPITIAIADELGGIASLSAVMSVLTGVAGATLGPVWLDLLGVRHPLARGLAHGVASHGIGTARMFDESELAGATASVGMALGGLAVALLVPIGWP